MAMTPQEEARRKAEKIWPTEDETSQIIRAQNYKFQLGFVRGYTADRWIDCKVRLPDTGRNVIGFTSTGRCRLTFRDGENYALDVMELMQEAGEFYTHWCEFPQPPKTNEG